MARFKLVSTFILPKYQTHLLAIQRQASVLFREDHPDLIEERKKSDLPEKPKTPQQLWYNHEKKTYMKIHPDVKEFLRKNKTRFHVVFVHVSTKCVLCFNGNPQVSQKELKEALRRQWSQLSDKKRLKWISKALELQKLYEVWLLSASGKDKRRFRALV